MSRRLLAHMVVRNEADRYLDCVLSALSPHVHEIHVYDDLSTDSSAHLAFTYGARLTSRPPGVPTLVDHEGAFRSDAWRAFETAMRPGPEDWVLCLDADEILVAPDGLHPAIDAAGAATAVLLPIPEVYGRDDAGGVLVRTDGFWGSMAQDRLVRYRPGRIFRDVAMGCGSTPVRSSDDVLSLDHAGVELLHLGYLDPLDRIAKHNRYAGRTGHSAAHIASILTRPTMAPWRGPPVNIWKGGP